MKRTPLARKTPLKRGESRLSRSTPMEKTRKAPMRKVNPERMRRVRKMQRAEWRSPEQQAVRTEAFERAGNRCEHVVTVGEWEHRCRETEKLEAHHLRYPKTRPLRASDLRVLCRKHHELEEMTHYSYRHTSPRGLRGGR